MDNNIIELILGLVLIYAALALLVMKVQEQVFGQWLHYRAYVMHDLLLEGCGENKDLKEAVLTNPLVFALYKDDNARQGRLVGGKGPTAVPPDIFAKALLTELHQKGKGEHPALKFTTPAAFLNAKAAQGERIWQTLQILLPGNESDWPGFETAIARWFSDIGDRSDGWFKRKAANWSLFVSVVVVLALNVDSFHIANTLATDPPMRLGLNDLALRIDAFRQSESDRKNAGALAAPENLAAQASTQFSSRMTDAITRLNDAYRRDTSIGSFRAQLGPIETNCSFLEVGNDSRKARSEGKFEPNAKLGNSDVWLLALPLIQIKVEKAQFEGFETARGSYKHAFDCLAQISGWVRTAVVATNDGLVRSQMQEAAVALESAKSALVTLAKQQSSASLRRAFLADPAAVRNCAASPSRADFDACLQRELLEGVRIPFLWSGQNLRAQFCDVVVLRPAPSSGLQLEHTTSKSGVETEGRVANTVRSTVSAPTREASGARGSASTVPTSATAGGRTELDAGAREARGSFCSSSFEGSTALGIAPMELTTKGFWAFVLWILGLLVTATFVSLGAPFWFDLLSRVVKLRSGGTVRDATADELKARGTLPPLPPRIPREAPSPVSNGGPTGASTQSRNAFEAALVPADIIRLQQALAVTASGTLDGPTRGAVRSWCSDHGFTPVTDELNLVLYQRIAGRPAANSARVGDSTTARTGEKLAGAAALGMALTPVLDGFDNGAGNATNDVVTADLRAQAVLFRYKRQRWGDAPSGQPLKGVRAALAELKPGALDVLDEALIQIVGTAVSKGVIYPRESPPWMDWAIGELGQVEIGARNRQGSNPRICEYLDTTGNNLGQAGDATPWCGAFICWCLQHSARLQNDQMRIQSLVGVAVPARAASWEHYGNHRQPELAQYGDLVIFDVKAVESSGHVAFVVARDANTVWALGGNQQRGTRVCVSAFSASLVRAVRAP